MKLFDNWPFMRSWVEEGEDGQLYTKVETGPAATIVPCTIDAGHVSVALLGQIRPEVGGTWQLKAAGGYNRERSFEACAKDELLSKLGIAAKSIVRLGRVKGYSVVQLPIEYFLTLEWESVRSPGPGCTLITLPIEKALGLAMTGALFEDVTVIAIMHIAHLIQMRLAPFSNSPMSNL